MPISSWRRLAARGVAPLGNSRTGLPATALDERQADGHKNGEGQPHAAAEALHSFTDETPRAPRGAAPRKTTRSKGSPTPEQPSREQRATMSRSVATEQSDFESKMLLVKQKKKQAEHDKRLLVNRIALLKKEERKAYKKIEKTKERAQEVLTVRIEHERHHSERVARRARNERRRKLEPRRTKASEAEARGIGTGHAARAAVEICQSPRSAVEAAQARDEIRAEQLADVVEKQRKRAEVKEHEAKLRERKQQEMQGILKRNRPPMNEKLKKKKRQLCYERRRSRAWSARR